MGAVSLAVNLGAGSFVPDRPVAGMDRRFMHLHFLDDVATTRDIDRFHVYRRALEGAGLARISLMAPFVPTVPGTNRHIDDGPRPRDRDSDHLWGQEPHAERI